MTNQEKRELIKQAYAYGAAIALREHGVSFFEAEKTAEELAEGEMPPAEEEAIDPQQLEELAQTPEGRSILSRIMGGAGGALGGAMLGGLGGALGGRVIGNLVNRAQGKVPLGIDQALRMGRRSGSISAGASNTLHGAGIGGAVGTGLGAMGGLGEGVMGENDEGERSMLSRVLGGAGGLAGGAVLGGVGGNMLGRTLGKAFGSAERARGYYPTRAGGHPSIGEANGEGIGTLTGLVGGGVLGRAAAGGGFD